MNFENLFRPFRLKSLNTRNRFVMSPMTSSCSHSGVPTADVANYYRQVPLGRPLLGAKGKGNQMNEFQGFHKEALGRLV
jgi:2,4-dienoyl-CoA reductase-like NADH-dependent reductase (Old Yellow Enzyme family)